MQLIFDCFLLFLGTNAAGPDTKRPPSRLEKSSLALDRQVFVHGVYPRGKYNIVFVKIPKCASSTTAGIARRIAAHQGLSGVRYRRWITKEKEPGVWANHNKASVLWPLMSSLQKPVFKFTFLRDPVERCLSAFYFFGHTTNRSGSWYQATENKISALAQCRNFMFDYINPEEARARWNTTAVSVDIEGLVRRVIQAYDFIGITGNQSIFDASVHLLVHSVLSLPLRDGLYLSSKRSGGMGIGSSLVGISHPPLAQEAQEVQAFANGTHFRENNVLDLALVEAVTSSIREQYARDLELQASLAIFFRLRKSAEESCNIDWANFSSTNWIKSCYWFDNGCGFRCLDEF